MTTLLAAAPMADEDFASAAELFCLCFGGGGNDTRYPLECFKYWSVDNPAWTPGTPRGWVVKESTGRVVGYVGSIPNYYVAGGRNVMCASASSVASHPDLRGKGLGKAVGRGFLDQENIDLITIGGSTDVAWGMWLALGCLARERDWRDRSALVPGDGGELVNRATRGLAPRFVGNLLAPFFYTAKPRGPLAIERVAAFQDRDEQDLLNCRATDAEVFSLRDVRTLNWLNFGAEYIRATRVALIARSGGQAVGYLSMKRLGSRFYLTECRCLDADWEVARELLIAAQAEARSAGASFIEVWEYSPMLERAIDALRVFRRKGPQMPSSCYLYKNADLERMTFEAAPTDGDLAFN